MPDIAHHLLVVAAHELVLFAASGFALFAIDETLVDVLWICRGMWKRLFIFTRVQRASVIDLPESLHEGKIAVFVPAWDEAGVISAMLRHLLSVFDHGEFEVLVGCYPNDPHTTAVIRSIDDKRVRLVIGDAPGPTTKAGCLNTLWRDLVQRQSQGEISCKGVLLHDAEDMVAPFELELVNSLLDRFDMIQLPVVPEIDPRSHFIAGHYCDEFAEAHGKTLVVREMVGAGVPSAGVGCAVRFGVLERLAADREGQPFDANSLTEDYELGVQMKAFGWKTAFVRLPGLPSGQLVATRAHFPTTLETAVRQKTRWMVGIALAGWDRLGWGQGLGENWMRVRDRRAILAAILIMCGYLAALLFGILFAIGMLEGEPPARLSPILMTLLAFNSVALMWRCAVRAFFVWRLYGPFQAGLAMLRMPVGSIIAILAARRAVLQYLRLLRGDKLEWDKTSHKFPDGASGGA